MVKLLPLRRPSSPPSRRDGGVLRRASKVGGMIPNALTIMGLCAGLSAIRFGLEGNLLLAALGVLAAHLFDILDGRFARLLDKTSRFGEILDSLADFLNFGIAPVLILYQWQLVELGNPGWIVALFYVVCCALRLARFSADAHNDKPHWQHGYFTGLAAPAAANLVLAPVYFHLAGVGTFAVLPQIVAAVLLVAAMLMISRVPFFSGKSMEFGAVRRIHTPILLAGLALFLTLLVYYTWIVILALLGLYLCSLPFSVRSYLAHKRGWNGV
ncbi:MAG: phosphatidylcholine/phosphatidylserine synthase [Hyphomicrobiales bacterium]|nr:phosphatidylcholine/phosphatidylserine synthase [Hyphomicrobiales bacterium]MCY4054202.1 phosphatidylcholine/phosphatidylserine synthase [Hyphomicrobiales bacterium]